MVSSVDRNKYQIMLPLPPKIDPSVTMMTVEDKPDITYGDVGGSKDQIEKLREVVEMPLLSPERFVNLGIDPPQGCTAVRTSRYRKNALCSSSGQPYRRYIYSCHW